MVHQHPCSLHFPAQVPCGQRYSTRPRTCAVSALRGHAWGTMPSASQPTTLSVPQSEWSMAMTPSLASLPEACESFTPRCATAMAARVMKEFCMPGPWATITFSNWSTTGSPCSCTRSNADLLFSACPSVICTSEIQWILKQSTLSSNLPCQAALVVNHTDLYFMLATAHKCKTHCHMLSTIAAFLCKDSALQRARSGTEPCFAAAAMTSMTML